MRGYPWKTRKFPPKWSAERKPGAYVQQVPYNQRRLHKAKSFRKAAADH
jgi:hypothetical protein